MCISISACRDVVRCLFFSYECRNWAEVRGHGRKGVNCVPAICGKFGFSSHHGKETTMKKCNHQTNVAKNLNVCIEIFLVHPQRSKTPVWEVLFGGAKDRAGPPWPHHGTGQHLSLQAQSPRSVSPTSSWTPAPRPARALLRPPAVLQSFPVPSTARAHLWPGGCNTMEKSCISHHHTAVFMNIYFFNSHGFRMIFQAAYRSTCIFNMYIEKLDFILRLKSSFYSIVFNFAGIKDLILLHKIISYAVSALNNRDIY